MHLLVVTRRQNESLGRAVVRVVDRHTLHHAHTTSISVRKEVHTGRGITLDRTSCRPPLIAGPAWVGSVWSGLRSHYMRVRIVSSQIDPAC